MLWAPGPIIIREHKLHLGQPKPAGVEPNLLAPRVIYHDYCPAALHINNVT